MSHIVSSIINFPSSRFYIFSDAQKCQAKYEKLAKAEKTGANVVKAEAAKKAAEEVEWLVRNCAFLTLSPHGCSAGLLVDVVGGGGKSSSATSQIQFDG